MEAEKLSLLQQFIQQRDLYMQQSTNLQADWNKLQGAIFACNQMIDKIEQEAKDNQGETKPEAKTKKRGAKG